MQKKVGLVAVLVLLCGVSAYMWMSKSGTETDTTIAGVKETWTCSECGKDFELTTAKATAMLRTARHEIVCPFCDGAAEREGELVMMGGGLPSGGGDADNEAEEEDDEAPPEVIGSMGPIERP